MKPTDFAPRISVFLSLLKGKNLTGVEVGCDVGAHAEAILTYADVEKLYLVDTFDNQNIYWYLLGRLQTKSKTRQRFHVLNMDSEAAAAKLQESFDFIYIDITHDYESVKQSLLTWFPKLKKGGMLGYRNYSETFPDLKRAVDDFVRSNELRNKVESYQAEIIIYK